MYRRIKINIFDHTHVYLKDPFVCWVVHSGDNDALVAEKVDGGTVFSLCSHPVVKTKEEALSLPIGCSGSVSLMMKGYGLLCLSFVSV